MWPGVLAYFFVGKKRKRYRRAHQVSALPPSEEQPLAHVDDGGPHEYILVKECKQPTSAQKKGRKKRAGRRRVGRRMIIDIHLEVLNECQKGDLHLTKDDFFEILVEQFMGSKFMKEEDVPKEQVPCLDSGFRKEDIPRGEVLKENVPKEDVLCLVSGFREEDFVPK
ncbi:SICA antigen [Plasmodium coatneyi]|uniref:SICA antigen n=1 Tax=Plasmodium coatneyi TaxID=208452 RepID=A0A1B1DVW1_9APIC|nr:SICA antigen [Plasmodium coatneyi]ANQ06715.1 SICA antigen [Plasmodium coatneyi]